MYVVPRKKIEGEGNEETVIFSLYFEVILRKTQNIDDVLDCGGLHDQVQVCFPTSIRLAVRYDTLGVAYQHDTHYEWLI
jgi:hypothetical protein